MKHLKLFEGFNPYDDEPLTICSRVEQNDEIKRLLKKLNSF